jgi:1,4-dihydroxy-2-naphthoate octaprenyltransferase
MSGGTLLAAVLLSFWRIIAGLAALIRILPVLTWSMAAFGIGLGVAWADVGVRAIQWFDFLMVIAGGVLFQGVVAHALNDITDERSGTDRLSQGRLSGGTRVIMRGLLNDRHLYFIAALGLVASSLVTMVLVRHLGAWVWWIFLVGAWASLAYSMAPLRLAYRPFLGEWLCAWPATWVCVYGSGLILGGNRHSY